MPSLADEWREVLAELRECIDHQRVQEDEGEATTIGNGPQVMERAEELLELLKPPEDDKTRIRASEFDNSADVVEYLRGRLVAIEWDTELLKKQPAQRRHQLAVNIRGEVARIRWALGFFDV